LNEGEQYHQLKEVIFIAITDFVMFPNKKAYKSDHVTLDRESDSHDLKDFHFTINAVLLLGSGWTLEEVKNALFLDDETLSGYVKDYQEGGLSLLLRVDYKGSAPYLSMSQIEILHVELNGKIHLTTQSIVHYCENEFGISYTQSGMRDLLHRLGYEYKKPKLVPGNPDEEAQEIFAKQYEEFIINKPDKIEVLFMDAVHPQHNTMAAYGWIKRGEKRKIPTSSGRARLNLQGAMNAETWETTVIESDTVDAHSTIQLLETLEKKYFLATSIYVILDNAKYHYSKIVNEYLKKSRIELIFLPSYSPNLNLIERLWKFFKKKVLYNTYYEKLKDFRQGCIQFFRNIGSYQEELTSIMSGGFELD
jgi:transposase